ncbi:unnamed protein product [Closterium sp. NIES-64]|nr:unnamed protein product [Closterium sp. NIES-64]
MRPRLRPWVEKLLQLAACVTEIHRFSRRLLDARSAAISAAARASLAAALPASHSSSAAAPYSVAGATGGITSLSESGRYASHRVLAGAAGGASGLQRAFATCVEEEALLPYTHEVDRLFSSPLPVRTIWAKLSEYEQMLTGLVRVTRAIEQGNLTGAHLLRYLEQESSFGPLLLSIALDTCIRHCQRAWVGQLAHWMAFGTLPPDGGAEFFISRCCRSALLSPPPLFSIFEAPQNAFGTLPPDGGTAFFISRAAPAPGPGAVMESRAERREERGVNGIVSWDEYSINEAQLPPDFAPETAEAALFVGRAMLLLQEAGRRSESELSGRGVGSRQRKHEEDVKRILDSVLALRVSVSKLWGACDRVVAVCVSVCGAGEGRAAPIIRHNGSYGTMGMHAVSCDRIPFLRQKGRTKHAWDEQRVHVVVEAARKRAARRLWQLVVRESDLFGHLHAVHYFLLGGGGAFMQLFASEGGAVLVLAQRGSMWQSVSAPSTGTARREEREAQSVWQSLREVLAQPDVRARVANDKLQLAVEKVGKSGIVWHVLSCVTRTASSKRWMVVLLVRTTASVGAAGGGSSGSVNWWDRLEMNTRVAWPLQLVLSPAALQRYNSVAAFLFRLRRVALELQLAWLLLCKVRPEGARMRGLPEKGPRGVVARRGEGVRGGEGGLRGAGVGGVQGKGRGEAVGSGRGEEEGQMKRTWSLPAGSGEAVRSGGVDAGPATAAATAAAAAAAAGFTRSTSVAAGSVGVAGSGRGGSSGVVRISLSERKEHLMLCMMLKEMLQIVTSLQTYLHADVVEVEWAAFLASIRANPDFSFLLAAHDRFLASLERHVMLGNTHFTRPLHSLLVLAMKLCRRLHHSAPLPLPLLQDMRKVHPPVLPTALCSCTSELDAKACAVYLSVGMLHHSVSTPQVHKLLTQINFNGFYSLSTS